MKKDLTDEECQARFNRYMVECEFFRTKTGRKCNSVLIDTWWNVNKELADNLLFTFSF